MHLRKMSNLPNGQRRQNNYRLQDYILEFYESDMTCAEVVYDLDEYCSSHSLQNGLAKSIHALNLQDQVGAMTRNNGVFLYKIP